MTNKFRERVQRRRQKLAKESSVPTAEEKRLLRLKKNREAAQASRDRRLREFRELHDQVDRLTNEKHDLVEEAERLRRETAERLDVSNEVSQLRASIALLKRENDELRLAAKANASSSVNASNALALPPLTLSPASSGASVALPPLASASASGAAALALPLPALTLSAPLSSASALTLDDGDVMMGGDNDVSFDLQPLSSLPPMPSGTTIAASGAGAGAGAARDLTLDPLPLEPMVPLETIEVDLSVPPPLPTKSGAATSTFGDEPMSMQDPLLLQLHGDPPQSQSQSQYRSHYQATQDVRPVQQHTHPQTQFYQRPPIMGQKVQPPPPPPPPLPRKQPALTAHQAPKTDSVPPPPPPPLPLPFISQSSSTFVPPPTHKPTEQALSSVFTRVPTMVGPADRRDRTSETAVLVFSPQLEFLSVYLLIQCVMCVHTVMIISQCQLMLTFAAAAAATTSASASTSFASGNSRAPLTARQQLLLASAAASSSKSATSGGNKKRRRRHRSMSPQNRKRGRPAEVRPPAASSSKWTMMPRFSRIPFFATSFRNPSTKRIRSSSLSPPPQRFTLQVVPTPNSSATNNKRRRTLPTTNANPSSSTASQTPCARPLPSSSRCLTSSRLAAIRRHFPFKRLAQFLARPCGHRSQHCQSSNRTPIPMPTTSSSEAASSRATRTPTSSRTPRSRRSSSRSSPALSDSSQEVDKENHHCSDIQSSLHSLSSSQCSHAKALPLRVVDCKQCVKRLYLAMIARFCPHALRAPCAACVLTRNSVRVYLTSALVFYKRQQQQGAVARGCDEGGCAGRCERSVRGVLASCN